MFYSHEILTSRKYGVATVWLVATLGSKSNLKRVNKKAICNVDVPKACNVVISPEAPMALRLQSNLLFGVSRVYDRQCGYVLGDAQQMQASMRQLLKSAKNSGSELDLAAGQTRPDALLVPDDPNYLPDLALTNLTLDLDLGLNLTELPYFNDSSQISMRDSGSSRTSLGTTPSIRIPTSASAGLGGMGVFGGFNISEDGDTIHGQRLSVLTRNALGQFDDEVGGFLPEDDFAFDEEGNLYEINCPTADATQVDEDFSLRRAGSATSNVEIFQRGRTAAPLTQRQMEEYDYDAPPVMDDGYHLLPAGRPLSPHPHQSDPRQSDSQQLSSEREEGSEYATAPQRRKKRSAKVLKPDRVAELHASEIRHFTEQYLTLMAESRAHKASTRHTGLAKKNANFYVWGQGLGGVGRQMRDAGLHDPLGIFYGDRLRNAVLGLTSESGQKRDRASLDDDTDSAEERRVRPRSSQDMEAGRGVTRGEGTEMIEEEGMDPFMEEEEAEVGRHAPTPLAEEGSSLMPWNLSASQHSSAHPLQQWHSSRAPSTTSAPRRLRSASPLFGRGTAAPPSRSQSLLQPTLGPAAAPSSVSGAGAGFDMPSTPAPGNAQDDEARLSGPPSARNQVQDSQFEAFGPAAYVDTQLAGESQWMRDTLDTEAGNFLIFVETSINGRAGLPEDGSGNSIAFVNLLPVEGNTRIVAAQAFLHCLALATKGLLIVVQTEGFGVIELSF